MTIASGRINSQSRHDLICHVAKVKVTTSAYSMATKYLFSIFIIPFASNAQTKRKYIIFHRIKNTTSVTLSVYLCFNNVWSKHYRLRDSKLAKGSLRLSTDRKKKPRVDYEPHSAHGRAVKNNGWNNNRARSMAARLITSTVLASSVFPSHIELQKQEFSWSVLLFSSDCF